MITSKEHCKSSCDWSSCDCLTNSLSVENLWALEQLKLGKSFSSHKLKHIK